MTHAKRPSTPVCPSTHMSWGTESASKPARKKFTEQLRDIPTSNKYIIVNIKYSIEKSVWQASSRKGIYTSVDKWEDLLSILLA